jgi:hypothetical protein
MKLIDLAENESRHTNSWFQRRGAYGSLAVSVASATADKLSRVFYPADAED